MNQYVPAASQAVFTNRFVREVSFPLVGNPSSERLRASRSDKSGYHTLCTS